MTHVQAILVLDEGAFVRNAPQPRALAMEFPDRGDVDCAEHALHLATNTLSLAPLGLRRVSDWLADTLRRGESAARWALLVDDLGRNHSVRVGIMRGEVQA